METKIKKKVSSSPKPKVAPKAGAKRDETPVEPPADAHETKEVAGNAPDDFDADAISFEAVDQEDGSR